MVVMMMMIDERWWTGKNKMALGVTTPQKDQPGNRPRRDWLTVFFGFFFTFFKLKIHHSSLFILLFWIDLAQQNGAWGHDPLEGPARESTKTWLVDIFFNIFLHHSYLIMLFLNRSGKTKWRLGSRPPRRTSHGIDRDVIGWHLFFLIFPFFYIIPTSLCYFWIDLAKQNGAWGHDPLEGPVMESTETRLADGFFLLLFRFKKNTKFISHPLWCYYFKSIFAYF